MDVHGIAWILASGSTTAHALHAPNSPRARVPHKLEVSTAADGRAGETVVSPTSPATCPRHGALGRPPSSPIQPAPLQSADARRRATLQIEQNPTRAVGDTRSPLQQRRLMFDASMCARESSCDAQSQTDEPASSTAAAPASTPSKAPPSGAGGAVFGLQPAVPPPARRSGGRQRRAARRWRQRQQGTLSEDSGELDAADAGGGFAHLMRRGVIVETIRWDDIQPRE